jgi:hypothetical protein
MAGANSGGVVGLRQLPAFELPAAGGGRVRSWDYRGRRHLVLWLVGDRPDRDGLARAAARESAIRADGAELLVIASMPREQAAEIRAGAGFRGPVLADSEGHVHARLGAREPMLLVADRNCTVYWRAPLAGGEPDLDEALSWLGYLNILEPECGTCVPAWPPELMIDPA